MPRESESITFVSASNLDATLSRTGSGAPVRSCLKLWNCLVVALLFTGCKSPAPHPSSCKPDPAFLLDVTYYPQEPGTPWCWAASGQMVMGYHGVTVSQCQQAADLYGGDCCGTAPPGTCYQGGWPDFHRYGFHFNRTKNTALSWDQLQRQIFCKQLPFTFSWHADDNGHMFVAIGYHTLDDTNYVEIHDPWPVPQNTGIGGDHAIIPYDVYANGLPEPGISHWDDFYNIWKAKP